ncbi:thioredoxin-disulfide reductase [Pseudovibrio sp. FO-BEG1]|uniref:NAD(P)/FAD-dependent oxidoreductase n=1 Tax=Pseudovibrio sp. (strain FO-BEG1) TaxID=911045 RepID=UPI000238BFD1|nr:NAD(P)/FAD-dependent oxidoreductase [Pseudovibrio sp. FO-BEG1]AEV39445.1 thioredoxin-disulfide reductase [Pseudovibrio sp. FO-BEG1]
MHDVIVVGGSYAGMAAALQLLRARRSVLVIDAGERRNRFSEHAYGFLGQDGAKPDDIWAQARQQLDAYPDLTWYEGQVQEILGEIGAFRVSTDKGTDFTAHRILLATGVRDELPDIPGLAERWGTSVLHCPYCHGYELNKEPIAVIAFNPVSLHQAEIMPEWGPTTFFTNGTVPLEDEQCEHLLRSGVTFEDIQISRIEGAADVVLEDGRILSFSAIFVVSNTYPSSGLAQAAGCALEDHPMGQQIVTSEFKETTVRGVFACGDVARVPHSVSFAVGDGAWAGMQVHRSLLDPEL